MTKIKELWERAKGWRTVAFNVAAALLCVLVEITNYLAGFGGWSNLFPPGTATIIILVVNVVNIALRAVTTTPVGKAE